MPSPFNCGHPIQDIRVFNRDINTCTAMLYSKPKTERKSLVELVMDCEVLIWVIRCFYADPVLAFTVSDSFPTIFSDVHVISPSHYYMQYLNVDGQHMQSLQLMTGLATLVQDPSVLVLSRTAAQVLVGGVFVNVCLG